MADEAVIRIVMEGGAGGITQPASAGTPAAGAPPAPTGTPAQPPAPKAKPPFDPYVEVVKRYEREQQTAQVEALYSALYGEHTVQPPPEQPPPFDPVKEAQKRHEYEQRRVQIEEAYQKLYAVPIVEPPFDPIEEARKRYEAQKRRNEVEAAFSALYGEHTVELPPKKGGLFDHMLKAAEQMRGTIGGFGGRLAGIALDTTAAVRSGMQEGGALATGGTAAAIGSVAIAAAAVVGTFSLLNNEANKMAERYSAYSPEIAIAQTQAELINMIGDIQRSLKLGAEISEYIRAQARLQQGWEDAKAAFMKSVLPMMTAMVNVLTSILTLNQKDEDNRLLQQDFFNFNPTTAFNIPSGFGDIA